MNVSALPGKPLRRPLITLSYAQTLDGRLATRSGQSQWISGPESLDLTHEIRAGHDAIMVGSGTVLADDPRLTVRRVDGADPLRIIVDGQLRTSPDAALLTSENEKTIFAITEHAPRIQRDAIAARGAQLLEVSSTPAGHVELPELMEILAQWGVRSIMVEGGAGLLTALLQERLADRVVITVAPKILGRGISAIGDLGIDELEECIRLTNVQMSQHGVDFVVQGDLRWPGE